MTKIEEFLVKNYLFLINTYILYKKIPEMVKEFIQNEKIKKRLILAISVKNKFKCGNRQKNLESH